MALELIKIDKFPTTTSMLDWFPIANTSGETFKISRERLKLYLGSGIVPEIAESFNLGAPSVEKMYYGGAGTYILNGVSTPVNGSLNILLWDKSSWTTMEVPVTAPVANVVDKNNATLGTSGKAVYDFLSAFVNLPDTLSFVLMSGEVSSAGVPNTSVNWLRTDYVNVSANTDYTISGYGNNPSVPKVFYYSATAFLSSEAPTSGDDYFSFKTPPLTTRIIVQVQGGAGTGSNPSGSPFNQTFKIAIGKDSVISISGKLIDGDISTPQINKIEISSNAISKYVSEVNKNEITNITTGALLQSNGSIDPSNPPNYFRTSTANDQVIPKIEDGKTYTYSGEITSTIYAGVIYLSSSLSYISSDCSQIGVYDKRKLTPPSNAMYIATCSYGTHPVIESTEYIIDGIDGIKTIYVDHLSVNGDGTEIKPYSTISEALRNAPTNTVINVSEGDYRETLDLRSFKNGNIEISARQGHRVRILGSKKLTGWTKTAGYNNIYETTYSGVVYAWSRYKKPIFEDGRPSMHILPEETHPLQKGLSNRLPFTILQEKNSMIDLDSSAGVFYDGSTIYVHSSNGTNPDLNGFSYEIASEISNTYPDAGSKNEVNLTLNRIQFMFTLRAPTFVRFMSVVRYNCVSLATRGAGAFRDDVANIIAYNDEAGASDVDGINGHFSSFGNFESLTDNRSMEPIAIYFNPWCHDNMDDGISHHENHSVSIYGGLSEYNGDGGVRASNDSGYSIYNLMSRRNGWNPQEVAPMMQGGEGIAAVNAPVNIGRNGCKVIAYNSVFENNNVGVGCMSSNLNRVEIVNCITRNNATELWASAGIITSRNTLATNSDPDRLKKTTDTGVINVLNDDILT